MHVLQMLAFFALRDDCPASTPTINSVSKEADVLNACPVGWRTTWQVNITGALQVGQEYYWEVATNAAGDNWSFHSRGTGTQIIVIGSTGSDGPGASTTEYAKVRVSVVNDQTSEVCAGPVASEQASRTANLCVT